MSDAEAFLRAARESLSRDDGRVGRYVILRELGNGGMGTVYRAWDPTLLREVALKVLREETPGERARFRREATLLAGMRHPNIVPVYEVGEARGRSYLAMALVDGPSLAETTLDVRRIAELLAQAARAVHAAHEREILHRDIKPGNLLLDPEGRLYVADFGLARRIGDPAISTPGMIVGTPAFMSPEQAKGRPVDARSDVYSLGATLAELLPEDAPRPLEAVARKASAAEPSDRYPTALAFAEDLERWLAGQAVHAARPRRNRVAWALGLLLAATTAVAGVAIGRQRSRIVRLESFWNTVQLPKQYERLRTKLRPILERADAALYERKVPSPEETDRLVLTMDAELAKLEDPWHETSLPEAYRGWLLCHLGRVEDGEKMMRGAGRLDRGDPYGAVFLVRWRARKLARLLQPGTEEWKRELETLRIELKRLSEWKGWEETEEEKSYRLLVAGLSKVVEGKPAEVEVRGLHADAAFRRDADDFARIEQRLRGK